MSEKLQVVGSRCWPLISQYRASIRTQSPRVEIIDALYKPLANGEDDGIMRYEHILLYHTRLSVNSCIFNIINMLACSWFCPLFLVCLIEK